MRRWVERLIVWGGGAAMCLVAGSAGVHPAGAVVAGLAVALLIAGMLSSASS